MAISDWDKDNILKFSINNLKVGEDLTNFPVLLNISSSSGENNYDCSDIFDKLKIGDEIQGNDSYTKLLIHSDTTDGSNTFIDSSGSNYTITIAGDVHHEVDQAKFGNTSIYFDGTDDRLNIALSILPTTTSTFTIDTWVYTIDADGAINSNTTLIGDGTYNNISCYWSFGIDNYNKLAFRWYDGATKVATSTNTVTLNSWVHIAVVVNDSGISLFIDGYIESIVGTSTMTNRLGSVNNTFIGMYYGRNFNGYVDELRLSLDVARWTSNFTPPIGAYTVVTSNNKKLTVVYPSVQEHLVSEYNAYTALIIHSDDLTSSDIFIDGSANRHSITTVGNTHHSAVQAKFNNSSVYFDGSGDYLTIPTADDFNFGTGNFTIDWWEYRPATASHAVFCLDNTQYPGIMAGYQSSAGTSLKLYMSSGTGWDIANAVAFGAFQANVWMHYAIVRHGEDIHLFTDGVLGTTVESSLSVKDCDTPQLGRYYASYYCNVYIDEFRVSKGIARWTTDFDTATAPYAPELVTLLSYTHGSNEQLYCEIERWDSVGKDAQLWVKVPKVLKDQPTDLLVYYDKTQDDSSYIGDVGSVAGKNVWDNDFLAVYHMSQDPSGGDGCILDSTTNENHGTPYGSMTSSDLVNGQVGKCIDFDGSNDYIQLDSAVLLNGNTWTIESALATTTDNNTAIGNSLTTDYTFYFTSGDIYTNQGGSSISDVGSSLTDGTIHQYATRLNTDDNVPDHFQDAVTYEGSAAVGSTDMQPDYIGRYYTAGNEWQGTIDEVRFSNIPRSTKWLQTTYYSNKDGLCSIEPAGIYQITGHVKELGVSVQREVFLYERSSGELMDKIMSTTDGYYILKTNSPHEHNLVCLDDTAGIDYDDLILSKVLPTEQT